MAKSTATVESRAKDPSRHDVFVIGYHSDELGVLQAWDIELESESSKTQREVYMADNAARGVGCPHTSNAGGEPPALGPEGNQPHD